MPEDNAPPPDPADPVLALAAEYEAATLAALDALERSDTHLQMAACVRFGKAVAALRDVGAEDLARVNAHLLARGRIPDFAWRKIVVAMQGFAAG